MTTEEIKTAVEDYAKQIGLEYQASFVAKAQPADKVKNPQLNWLIVLSRNKAGRSMTFEYHEGCAHVVGYKQYHKTPYDKRIHDGYIRRVCETGFHWKHMTSVDYWIKSTQTQPAPHLASVLYCMCLDYGVLDHADFEEWASNYGYDIDSREAEKTYQLCLKQALELKSVLGESHINKFRELLQEY